MGFARLLVTLACVGATLAQPSPKVQERITAAIKATKTSNSTDLDYTAFVNPFIGTGEIEFQNLGGSSDQLHRGFAQMRTSTEMCGMSTTGRVRRVY